MVLGWLGLLHAYVSVLSWATVSEKWFLNQKSIKVNFSSEIAQQGSKFN